MRRQTTSSARARPVLPVRAAVYARVSSDQQAERHTIDSQVGALLARASADGHDVTPEFRFLDDGHSGASLIRPALERLRDLVAMSAIDLVYVHAPDRLARSYAHQAVLVEEFARAGVEVVFLNRPIGQTPEDTLLLQLQGMFAEYERTRIIERSRRGKRHLAQAGVVSVLTRAPYGHRYVGREAGGGTARFEVVEDKAEVVRRIFRWVGQERVSLATVSRRLFEAGVPAQPGRHDGAAAWSGSCCRTPPMPAGRCLGRTPRFPGSHRYARRVGALPCQAARSAKSRHPLRARSQSRSRHWSKPHCLRARKSSWTRTGGATASAWKGSAISCKACWLPEVRLCVLWPMAGALPPRARARVPLLSLHGNREQPL